MRSRNEKALKYLAVIISALVYIGAIVYGDVMFIGTVQVAFPSGFLGAVATAGAVVVGVSAIILPLAIHFWFSPGLQFVWGIVFWVLDILALSMNAILAHALATHLQDAWINQWANLSPATPMLVILGWGIAYLFDPSHKLRHAQLELEADQIDAYTQQLKQAALSGTVAQEIDAGARAAAAATVSHLVGKRIRVQSEPKSEPKPEVSGTKSHVPEFEEIAAMTTPTKKSNRGNGDGHPKDGSQ